MRMKRHGALGVGQRSFLISSRSTDLTPEMVRIGTRAQNLANRLGVLVEAPNATAYVTSDGTAFTFGQWLQFAPGVK